MQIGGHDDFFALGGDSLVAIKLISRLRQTLQVPLTVRALYEAPTVSALAEHVEFRALVGSGKVGASGTARRGRRVVSFLLPLMKQLRRAKVRLWIDGDQLRYQAPQGALTPLLLAELRNRKSDILEFLRRAEATTEVSPLKPVPRDGDLQMSLAQHRLWVLDQIHGPSPAYNISLALHLNGTLDVSALQRSFEAILRRHESLRTALCIEGDAARLAIAADCQLPWRVVDVHHFAPDQRLAEVHRQAREEALQPFDLSSAPLIRCVLWQLDARDHVLMMVVHHIAADGRSIEILAAELSILYEAYSTGSGTTLPPLQIQYADFAWHQRRALTDAVLQDQLSYWRKHLADMPLLLDIPTDRPRPAIFSSAGAVVRSPLSDELVDQIRQVAGRSSCTPYVVLLAAAAVLLARYTGREDVPIACPATHRDRPELDGVVGFFVNTLVLRLDLSGNPSFQELLSRARAVVANAYANQDVSFDKVVEALGVERNSSYPPLVQFSMITLDKEKTSPRLRNLTTEPFDLGNPSARYDLTLEIYEGSSTVEIVWIYNTALFDPESVSRMAAHLRNVLKAAVATPERTLAALPLLDETEATEITRTWNNTRADRPKTAFVHRMFEAQAETAPDAIALVLDSERLTYGDLNARANRLAQHLIASGVAADVPVGLYLDRSIEMVVSVLAVLKAGGAYLPLDPAYPKQRLTFMLEDAGAHLLLTQSRLVGTAPTVGMTVICVDRDADWLTDENCLNPAPALAGDHVAYVIYTSGSTGRPKGCQIEHRNLMHYLSWASERYFPEGRGGSFGLFTSLSFDLSVTSLFLPLLRGRTLRLFSSEATLDQVLQDYLHPDAALDAIKLTPAHISVLASLDIPETKVELAVVGGEQLLLDQVMCLKRLNPRMRIYNEYGPTEATVGCVVKEILPGDDRILIGRPIDNTVVYVLDKHLQPLPVGVPGELYIGGSGLARGYVNRPDLTAERFIPDPFCIEPGARLYRTGDLTRWLPSGDLEFIGRADRQAKIHGIRIELGEIETVLGQHTSVQQVVVREHTGTRPGKQLVGYIGSMHPPSAAELRQFVSARLPDYMVPSIFVFLDRLPLTVNGKIDSRALPEPASRASGIPDAGALPRNDMERTLADIWAQLLGQEQIGIHDNFFELGGDSILSLQTISRANQAGLRLTPRQLLQHPTIAGLAAVAETARPIRTSQASVGEAVPLTPIQHWFFEQDLPEPHHFNQSVLLDLREPLQPELLVQCVQHLVGHHEPLRMRFVRDNGGWRQVFGGLDRAVPCARFDLSRIPASERAAAIEARAAELQTQLSLDGDIMRVAYFDGAADHPDRLLWVIHHLVVDAVSWRILLDDLWTAYQQLREGKPIRLPAKTTPFQDWATRLVEHSRSDALGREQEFWLGQRPSQIAHLPVDNPGGVNTRASARQVRVVLGTEDTRSLLRDVPSLYRTQIKDILLAALARAFAPWAGGGTLPVDVEGHGREDLFEEVDLSQTVGWFTTLTPLMLDLNGSQNWDPLLHRIKEERRRIPNGGLGYGLLKYVREDSAQRLRDLPRSEVCFNYLGQLDQVLSRSSPFRLSRESAGPDASSLGIRSHVLQIDGQVQDGQLEFRWQYSANVHDSATIERLAQGFIAALRDLIAHCGSGKPGSVVASDFPLAGLSEDQLSKVAKLLNTVR